MLIKTKLFIEHLQNHFDLPLEYSFESSDIKPESFNLLNFKNAVYCTFKYNTNIDNDFPPELELIETINGDIFFQLYINKKPIIETEHLPIESFDSNFLNSLNNFKS
jgi:hypothetical protein